MAQIISTYYPFEIVSDLCIVLSTVQVIGPDPPLDTHTPGTGADPLHWRGSSLIMSLR